MIFARRVPIVPQMEIAECGAACLGMVLGYFRCFAPLAELREACKVSRDGVTAADIVRASARYGLTATAVKVEIEAIDELELPAIIHWEFNHFVVLERLRGEGGERVVDLVDPAVGRRLVSLEQFSRSFTGVAIEFKPGDGFRQRRRVRRSAKTYAALARSAAAPLTTMIGSTFLLELFAVLFPAATALVLDFVIRPRQAHWIPILAVVFAVAVLLRSAIALARDRILGGLEARIDLELATSLVKHLLTLPLAFFTQRGVGDLLNRVGALLAARESFARLFISAFDLLLVVAYAALMLVYDLRLGAVVVGIQLVMVGVTMLGRGQVRAALAARLVASGRAQGALVQAFADPETAKAFNVEALLTARYAAARSQELNARADSERAVDLSRQTLPIFEALSVAAVIWLGGRAVLADKMTLGVLSSFLSIQTLLAPPLLRIVTSVRDFIDLGPMLDSIDDIFDTPLEPTGQYVPDRIEGTITFENVSFRYGPKTPLLLDDVSFHLDAGERVAIAGASGAGKSTILKLILGFVQPTTGRILLDGRDLRDYDISALRAAVGTVLSGGTFFEQSLYDNVVLGAPDATPADVRDALEAACVADVVDALPKGALTTLGSGAPRLSGGQRQRLLLTRALVKDPAMLLLDEASSALDTELERRVQDYLSSMRCTMVVIAHRLSAVAFADRILFLEHGKIVQEGSYAALIRQPGPFQIAARAAGAGAPE